MALLYRGVIISALLVLSVVAVTAEADDSDDGVTIEVSLRA